MTHDKYNEKEIAYISFMCCEDNEFNCDECPENIGRPVRQGEYPCGQQNCWVTIHLDRIGDYIMKKIHEMSVEELEKELKEATQSASYVEEEIRLIGNEDLYKFAREFNFYANTVKKRLEKLKEIE